MIFGDYPINFGITCGNCCINLKKKNSWDFWNQPVDAGILMKFWRNCKKILKILKRNWGENFKLCEILVNFWKNSQKIVRKLQITLEKYCKRTLKKFWKYLEASENLSKGALKLNPAVLIGSFKITYAGTC